MSRRAQEAKQKKICETEGCGRPCVGFMSICKICYQRERRRIVGHGEYMGRGEIGVVNGHVTIDGLRYKIGIRGKAFYFDREWKLSSRDPKWVAAQISKAGG